MTTPDLVSWFDSLIMNLGKSFDTWHQDPSESTGEMDMVMDALVALWAELKTRD
jgi:hypothetical protein